MMASLQRILARIRAAFTKEPLDQELNEEMASHLEMAIEENLRRGMPVEEARRQAMARFGGVQQARERQREERGLPWIDVLQQDLRYTFRTLRRDRSFTLVAVLILALGIGANVAVFSVVNTILLRPLPFENAQQLVWIAPPPSKCGFSCATYSADAFDEFRAGTKSYQDVTGYFAFSSADNVPLTGYGEPVPATGIMVIGNFFQTMGVKPEMGRAFSQEEANKGARPVVMLTDAYWRRQFAADPAIVGKAIELNGTPVTVVGVLPPSFDFGAVFSPGAKVDMFTPAILDDMREWGNVVTFIGRLKPGVTTGQAAAEAAMVAPRLYSNVKYPESIGNYKDRVIPIPLKDHVSGELRRSLVALWSAVGMILLIVCVNLSNLLLARAAGRSKEFAMRSALERGAGCSALLTESLVLSLSGSVVGLMLAYAVSLSTRARSRYPCFRACASMALRWDGRWWSRWQRLLFLASLRRSACPAKISRSR
jgi:predicted permease